MRHSLVWNNLGALSTLLATSLVLAACGDSDDENTQGKPNPNPCENLANACDTVGDRMCNADGSSVLICKANADGCNVWTTDRPCGQHAACVDGECACNDECDTTGARRCTGDVLETCSVDAVGCMTWETTTDCSATGQACSDASGQAQCEGTCTSNCTAAGDLRCEGDVLQICGGDGEGCLSWQTSDDCAANVPAQVCDDTGATPACVSACSDSCPAENDVQCDGDLIETCTLGADGCLAWETTTDCSANTPAQTCDDSGATPVCADSCQDACPAEDDVQCNGDLIETCTVGTNGCLGWETTTDCSANTPAQTCDDAGGTPVCADGCQDTCPAENDVQCNGDIIETCTVGTDGCLAWETTTDCSANTPAQTCDDAGGTPACADPPAAGTCADPQVIGSLPFQVAGVDFPNDYTDDHDFSSNSGCSTANGAEAVFQITLTAGQTIRMQELTAFDAVIRVIDVCDDATATCLANNDFGEDFMFTAPSDGDYFIVLESYSATPTNVTWDFLVQEVPPEANCSNGADDDGDGDTDCADSDCFGAAGACETEAGYCTDGLDNDADGQSDCDDTDCEAEPSCAVGQGAFESFSSLNPNDLAGCTLVFTPNTASPDGYDLSGSCACAPAWPVTPGSGTVTGELSLGDDASSEHTLSEMASFSFFETDYTSFFVGSNGFVTFGSGDDNASATTANFFSHPRIAGLDDDLNPAAGANGTITVDETASQTAVTFDGVNHYGSTEVVRFQILMGVDGTVTITYLEIGDTTAGYAGLSNGASTGTLPSETDLLNVARAPQAAGQVLISEVHFDDANASGEGTGEFIEVYNPSGETLDLGCCTLGDNTGVFDIPDGTLIDPNSYLVFVRSADQAANGGIAGGVEYGNTIQLSNGNPENVSVVCSGTDIDVVPFDAENNWPAGGNGVSMQLSSMALDASLNDQVSVWCASTDAYGDGDLGTPGTANTDCAPTSYVSVDFETDPGWTAEGDWAWGAPDASYADGPAACAAGVGCYGTNLSGAYSNTTDFGTNYVQAPTMDLSAATGLVTMSFDMWLNVESTYDLAVVQVSTDGGTTWTSLGMTSPAYNGPAANPDTWTGEVALDWIPASADLSALAGESDVRVRWAVDADGLFNRAGFYLDNVRVVGF